MCGSKMSPLEHMSHRLRRSSMRLHETQLRNFINKTMNTCTVVHKHLELFIPFQEFDKSGICHKNEIFNLIKFWSVCTVDEWLWFGDTNGIVLPGTHEHSDTFRYLTNI